MKKYIGFLVVLSVLFLGASVPKVSKAYTLDDLMAQLTSLQQQVTGLQSAMALKAVQVAPVKVVTPIAPITKTVTSTPVKSVVVNNNIPAGQVYEGSPYSISWNADGTCSVYLGDNNIDVYTTGTTHPQPPANATECWSGNTVFPASLATKPHTAIVTTASANIPPSKTTAQVATATVTPKVLSIGLKNNSEVKAFQSFLQGEGYLPTTAIIDGSYGSSMQSAVIKFQKAKNIAQTGVIDSATRSALTTLLTTTHTASRLVQVPHSDGGCAVYDIGANGSWTYISSGTEHMIDGNNAGCIMSINGLLVL